MYKRIISLVFLLGSFVSHAQIEIGSWIDYLPYSKINTIEDAGDRIYAATPYSVLEIIKEDRLFSKLPAAQSA